MATQSKTRTRFFRPQVEVLERREVPSTFYVAPTGSDANAGTSAAPWATLQRAANTVVAGDTVIVRAGTYKGFELTRDGTSSSPITFQAESGVIINQAANSRGHGINLEGASWVVIEGFRIEGNSGAAIAKAGIRSVENDHVTIRNNFITACGFWGILTGFSDYVTIEGNTTTGSVNEHGIYVGNSCVNPIIRNNVIYANYANGIHMNGDQYTSSATGKPLTGIITGALVDGNVIYNNGTGGGSAINCDGVQSSIIRNNLIYNTHASGISLYKIDGSDGAKNNTVVNNTVLVAADGRWALNIMGGSTGNTVFNNIFWSDHSFRGAISITADSLSGFVSNYNAGEDRYSADGGNTVLTLAQWRTQTGRDLNSLVAAPSQLFVNVAANDYHLSSTSPARDQGAATLNGKSAPTIDLDGKTRPSGTAYDIGAYEFQVATNAAPTVATAAAASPSIVTGTTTNLSVLGADDGGEANLTYTWAASTLPSGATPTFSANGTNAAKNSTVTFNQAGSYTFTVTIRDAGGLTVTSSVNVTVDQTLTTITVSPASVTLRVNRTQQFTATAKDQFGTALTAQPTFGWSVASGGGSITAAGLYTAPSTAGSAVVRAAVGAVAGIANVTIVRRYKVTAPAGLNFRANTTLAIAGLSVADPDVNEGTGLIEVTLSVGNGALTLAVRDGLTFSAGDGVADSVVTFSGDLNQVNVALASLLYRPSNDFGGPDTLTITANDLGNQGGPAALDTELVTLSLVSNLAALQTNPLKPSTRDLVIYGTPGPDTIRIVPKGTSLTKVVVSINRVGKGTFAPTGRLLVFGQDGDDAIIVSSKVGKRAWLQGNAGHDTLAGGKAADVLQGGDGNDRLAGRAGRDLLIGGLGRDSLTGGAGEDILIGASTLHAPNPQALNAVLREWTRTNVSYRDRIRHLLGTLSGGKNGSVRLNRGTVLDDSLAADVLTGGADLDWFWRKIGSDRVTDRNQGGQEILSALL